PLFTVRAFAITALSGLGRIPGALLGGLLLGHRETPCPPSTCRARAKVEHGCEPHPGVGVGD
ncbi:MAG: hypothetical protein Q9O62_02975, partial [Ardenticatenia bacterium]|nr:hypothetical protein [Ardenticatenia bacterium]